MMDDLLAKEEMGWMHSQYEVFDHRIHRYTENEVAERLALHLGRQIHYMQSYSSCITSLMGNLTREGEAYHLDNGMHNIDLTRQLTDAKGIGSEDALFTILEINRTDLHLSAS